MNEMFDREDNREYYGSAYSNDRTTSWEAVQNDDYCFTSGNGRTATGTLEENTHEQYEDIFEQIAVACGAYPTKECSSNISQAMNEIQDNKWLLHAYDLEGRMS